MGYRGGLIVTLGTSILYLRKTIYFLCFKGLFPDAGSVEDILSPLGSALAGAAVTVTRAIGACIFKADVGRRASCFDMWA